MEGDTKRARRLPKPKAEAKPEAMRDPVAFWTGGQSTGQVDAAEADTEEHLLLDLGEEWTPYILWPMLQFSPGILFGQVLLCP
jgi:hypothetical protein